MNLPNGKHHPAAVYAKQVVYGRLKDQCCPYEIKACERHLRDLERQGTEEFPYVFDCTRADRIYQAFALARHCRGPMQGQPIGLEPWQQFDLGCLYGWVHKDTGFRRFNRSLNERQRGTAKSTENSVKGLYHMTADCYYRPYHPEEAVFELSPEVECVAFDRDQARRVLDDAKMIAEISPEYAKRLKIPKSNPIVNLRRGGHMRALSKIVQTKNGLAPSYYCIDEYQEHKTSAFYDLGFNSFGKRNQPLLDCIMTAGDDADNSPAHREVLYAKRILDGELVDEEYFVMIREVPDGIDPHDKSKWCWANPMFRYDSDYAKTIYKQVLTEYNAAYGSGDAEKIRKFLSRRLCRWQTSSEASYLTEPQREQAERLQVDREEFAKLVHGLPSWPGFDLAKRIDLTGTAMVTPLPDGRIAVCAHGFMPEEGVARHEHTDRVPYKDWAKDGYVTVTPGAVTDNSFAYDWICYQEQSRELELINLGYDGHNAVDLALAINADRRNEDFCVEIRQTCAGQTFAVKTFREMLMQGRLVFEKSPLLMWCLKNAVVFENYYGDIRLSKKHKDDSQRIDPLAAVMDALSLALLRDEKADLSRAAGEEDYEM
ncbi:MAG: terminase large subunit [Ruminococcaceae bacterium]|nr:terminase large subunit [Oscillospiraceae bacterium]